MSQAFSGKARAPHLTRGQSGVAGEVGILRREVEEAFDAMEQSGVFVARFVGLSTDATAVAGIKAAFASAAAPQTLTGVDFDGPLAPGTEGAIIKTPKKCTLTVGAGGTPADWLGGDVIWTGTDVNGAALEETVASAPGAGTTTTTNYFATVEQFEVVDPQAGVGAVLELGVLADTGAIASITSSTSAQILESGDSSVWNRARLGNRKMAYPRRISFVFSVAASWIASSIQVTGPDVNGKTISSSIAVPPGGGATVTTDKFFAGPVRISVPAQGAALGTCQVGPFSASVGLAVDPISDVEAVAVTREAARADAFSAWAVPAAGALDDSSIANAGPYGAYTPNAAVVPNGVREHLIAYFPKAA